MINCTFEGHTEMNKDEAFVSYNDLAIKTDSVLEFLFDGGRFNVYLDRQEIYNDPIADNDFSFMVEQINNKVKKGQGVVMVVQEHGNSHDRQREQTGPFISIDGNSQITFGYDRNRLDVHIDGEEVLKTFASNDFSLAIYNV